jgi:peptidoglycan hydrolase-like protein with peptidoglycan-binding domain
MRVIISETQLKKALKSSLNENDGKEILDKILSWTKDKINQVEKLFDDPKKADKIDVDVDNYYNKLEAISGPIDQQQRGGFKFQESVEAVQIGLILLGYELPRFGVDGLFGPETAEAVNKFKEDNNIADIPLNEGFINAGSTNYSNLKFSSKSSGDNLSQALLDDIQAAASSVNVVAKVTTANTGHSYLTTSGNVSRHTKNIAVDIGYLNGKVCNAKGPEYDCGSFKTDGDKLKDALVSMGYVWNKEKGNQKAVLWQTYIGGNHYNHLHVSNNGEASNGPVDVASTAVEGIAVAIITVDMVKVMISKLQAGNLVTRETLKTHVDPAKVTGGSEVFSDLDVTTSEGYSAYRKICDNYIATRNPSGPITGTMMADGAKMAMEKYRKYVPPELALAQITVEGGLATDYTNKPHRTKNPFNVGQNKTISNPQPTYQAGIDIYYSLIARRYMTNGKTASNLIMDFKNDEGSAYAEAGYEKALTSLIASIRKKNESIYKELAV